MGSGRKPVQLVIGLGDGAEHVEPVSALWQYLVGAGVCVQSTEGTQGRFSYGHTKALKGAYFGIIEVP